MEAYKKWVRNHPSIVQNLDWVLLVVAFNPGRLSSSEFGYEVYHGMVGLLSVWHNKILEDADGWTRSSYRFWLDALEQVQIIIELRAMHLDALGKCSRYGPLTVLEVTKALFKMCMWSQYSGHIFLKQAAPEDIQLMESEKGLHELGAALKCLREKYAAPPAAEVHHLATDLKDGSIPASFSSTATTTCSATTTATSATTAASAKSFGAHHVQFQEDVDLQIPSICWREARSQGEPSSSGGWGDGVEGCGDERGDMPSAALRQQYETGARLVYLAEVLHIWRPVIYVSLLHRYGTKSWIPWLGSLSIDTTAPMLMRHGKQMMSSSTKGGGVTKSFAKQPSISSALAAVHGHTIKTSLLSLALLRSLKNMQWTPGEEMELEDRRRKMLLYLLRSPFKDSVVMRGLDALRSQTAQVPLLGFFFNYAKEMTGTFTAYYTYTAGS